MRGLLAAIVLLLSVSAPAASDWGTPNGMLVACRELAQLARGTKSQAQVAQTWDTAICLGKIDAMMHVGPGLNVETRFCRPPKTTLNQGIEIAVRFIEEHPETWSNQFESVVLAAFRKAWPCP